MNRVELIGRLTKDVEVFTTEKTTVGRYTLAVDRRFGDGADFISVVVFGKGAEFAQKYFKKGQRVAVTGRIQTGSYEKDGRKNYTFDVVADDQEFADSKKSSDGFEEVSIEELPFK